MIDGLEPYPGYKDSGVPWLRDVPGHWEVRQLGRFGLLTKGNGGSKDDEVTEGVPCVRYGDLYTQYGLFIDRARSCVSPERATSYTPIRYGDVLFAASGETVEEIGKSAVNLINSPAVCGGDVLRFTPAMPVNPRFMGYACDCPASVAQKSLMGRGFTVVHIYGSQLKSLWLALPPLPEQAAIVRFLDHADRRIRRYVRAKQKLIKLLEEQKQAIIHRAVTRGLDPNVRLKPSGVEWLGDVPEHWEVCPVRRMISLITSGSRGWADYYSDDGDIFIQSGNLGRSLSLNFSYIQHVKPPAGTEGVRTSVRGNDVLVCITGALTGNVIIVDVDLPKRAFVNQHVALLRPKQEVVLPRYLAFALRSEVGQSQFKTSEYGGTKQGLGLDDVKSTLIALPPPGEQVAICAYLDESLAVATSAMSAAQREISLLREYRTRLIADVVTGKLDVREAAARLPDEPDEPEPPDATDAEPDADESADDLDAEAGETAA